MATGSNLTSAKAIYGAVLGFVAPAAVYLFDVSGDGVSGNEWLKAILTAVISAGAIGATVYSVENKPKA